MTHYSKSQVEPIIQPGHESEVHHILLYGCKHTVSMETIGKAHECFHRNMPSDFWGCSSVILVWGIGGEVRVICSFNV